MEEARQLSNEELHETVKGFWGSNLPPFEDFEKCGKGLRADDKKKAWFIRQSGNFIRIEVETNGNVAVATDNVPDGALDENPDGSVNVYNEAGEKVGTATKEQVAAAERAVTTIKIEQ